MAHVVEVVLQFVEPMLLSEDGTEVLDPSPATADTHRVWQEVTTMFGAEGRPVLFDSGHPPHAYAVTVVADDVFEYFSLGADAEHSTYDALDVYEERDAQLAARIGAGAHPHSGIVEFHFTDVHGGGEVPPSVVRQFVDQFWLAFNLALPGAFDLDAAYLPSGARGGDSPPSLRAEPLWGASAAAVQHGWPRLERLPFRQVWEWLHADMLYDLVIAESPSQKALTNLLLASQRQPLDPANVLSVAQAIEGLLTDRSSQHQVTNTLRQRLDVILHPTQADWKRFAAFYEMRSRIVHGDAPVWRPQHHDRSETEPGLPEHARTQRQALATGLGVLLALLQDLITANARTYRFDTAVTVTRAP